ncbi:MAG: bifunctional pyr operon transcriptional regulator/uracil phosphoribosyltransferase, partial [Verrucomicrobia bacterium]|nr:bifunctional pyr operon transcriptional regulator/uracil phosphoribosyltransferase [Verrucomicrobiota bacterium]
MADEKLILDADAIQRGLTRIAHEIAEANADSASVGLIGIQRGGVHLAGRLAKLLAGIWSHDAPLGVLDVSMHRDDIGQRGIVSVQPTEVPFDVEG